MRHRLSIILCLIASAAALIGCRQESLEKEGFQLYYSGVTNIGPNLTVNLTAHHFGGEPEDFAITEVKFNGNAYDGPEFTISPEEGTVTVAGVQETQAGDYTVSVSCKVSGTVHNYPDIIEVTFFKGVPDEIKVSPDTLILDLSTLKKDSQANDTTATITTDGDHIAVTGYRIANVRFGDEVIDNIASPHFKVSEDGIITVLKNDSFKIGTYSVDLKLNTSSFGSESEVGLFTDALTVKVVSVPVSFSYTPDSGLLEEEENGVKTFLVSAAPVLEGSNEDVRWRISGCTPANDKLLIDPQTGVLSIKEGHGLKKDVTYVVDVNVRNKYSTDDGLTIKGAYIIEVVGYIAPIEHFGYTGTSIKQGLGCSVSPDAETDREHIRHYEWTDAEAPYAKVLVLDSKTGEITVAKGNDLPVGNHEISVTAANGKTGGEVVAVFSLEITENPYYFTHFSYGNNLDLSEKQTKGVSQFRTYSGDELKALTAEIKFTDMTDEAKAVAKWSMKNCNKLNNMKVDQQTGAISLPDETGDSFSNEAMGIALITASVTDPEDSENTFSVTVPFCVDFAGKVNGVTVTFDPFVLRANPKTGGRSSSAMHEGVADDEFLIDFRRSFNYYNIHGTDSEGNAFVNGAPNKEGGSFLKNIWDKFTEDTGLNKGNYGAKLPVSYYNGSIVKSGEILSATGIYVDNTAGTNQHTVVVNPGVWYTDGWADGIFTGQMTFATDGAIGSVNNGGRRAPVAIWLDKDFEE